MLLLQNQRFLLRRHRNGNTTFTGALCELKLEWWKLKREIMRETKGGAFS